MAITLAVEIPAGRPPMPRQLQSLIRRMAIENPSWGEERIANELLLKLDIQVSPRTVGKYMPHRPPGRPRGDLRWSIFLRLHAQCVIACDFMVVVTAHPTSAWTLQQLREATGFENRYQFLVHDRDSIFCSPTPNDASQPSNAYLLMDYLMDYLMDPHIAAINARRSRNASANAAASAGTRV